MNRSAQAISVFNKRARQYESKYMDVSMYHQSLDAFCSKLDNPNASVLELACGPGNITRYVLQQHPGFKILATDLAPDMLTIAKEHNPGIETQLLDCRNITSLGKKFDGIICGFALPYLSKEEAIQLINDTAAVLNDNGVLYLSTMEADYHTSGYQTSSYGDTVYVYYHEAGYITEALEKNGYTICHISRNSYLLGNDNITDLLIVAHK